MSYKTRSLVGIVALPLLWLGAVDQPVHATELVRLSPENWDSFVSRGNKRTGSLQKMQKCRWIQKA